MSTLLGSLSPSFCDTNPVDVAISPDSSVARGSVTVHIGDPAMYGGGLGDRWNVGVGDGVGKAPAGPVGPNARTATAPAPNMTFTGRRMGRVCQPCRLPALPDRLRIAVSLRRS